MEERQVIVTWHRPEEKLPAPGEIVVMSVSGKGKNMSYDHAFALGWWLDDGLGWELEGVELLQFEVHAWCDLEPYGLKGRAKDAVRRKKMTNAEAIGILAIVVETEKGRCFVTDEAISEAYAMAIKALKAYTPCDLCIYNPPSSMDGKPCSCCPAEPV